MWMHGHGYLASLVSLVSSPLLSSRTPSNPQSRLHAAEPPLRHEHCILHPEAYILSSEIHANRRLDCVPTRASLHEPVSWDGVVANSCQERGQERGQDKRVGELVNGKCKGSTTPHLARLVKKNAHGRHHTTQQQEMPDMGQVFQSTTMIPIQAASKASTVALASSSRNLNPRTLNLLGPKPKFPAAPWPDFFPPLPQKTEEDMGRPFLSYARGGAKQAKTETPHSIHPLLHRHTTLVVHVGGRVDAVFWELGK